MSGGTLPAEGAVKQIEARLMSDLGLIAPWLAALDGAGRDTGTDPAIARSMLDAGLEGIEDLTADRLTGGALAERQGPALARYFVRVVEDEATGRAHLGLPPPKPVICVSAWNRDPLGGVIGVQSGPL